LSKHRADTVSVNSSSCPAGDSTGDPADNAREAAPALDLTTLVELFDADHSAIEALLAAAFASIEADAAALAANIAADNRTGMIETAHRLKGTSGTIGAAGLVEVAARIEAGAHSHAALAAESWTGALRSAVRAVAAEVAAYRAER
jgi:HPt (histidine-containing phosphotransfer) domain-containing protein